MVFDSFSHLIPVLRARPSRVLRMTSAYTIRQIAEALGIKRRAAAARADTQRWPFEEKQVRGGRQRLYPIRTLPEEVQAALLLKFGPGCSGSAERTTARGRKFVISFWRRQILISAITGGIAGALTSTLIVVIGRML